jgi:hypothetical protein
VTISCACFVPKPFTPFEFEPQDTMEMLREKQAILRSCIRSKKITLNWHDARTGYIEAVLARGDRRLSEVLYRLFKQGHYLESWTSTSRSRHGAGARRLRPEPAFYANRCQAYCEVMLGIIWIMG